MDLRSRRGVGVEAVADTLTGQVRDVFVRTPDGSIYRRGAGRVAQIRIKGDEI